MGLSCGYMPTRRRSCQIGRLGIRLGITLTFGVVDDVDVVVVVVGACVLTVILLVTEIVCAGPLS